MFLGLNNLDLLSLERTILSIWEKVRCRQRGCKSQTLGTSNTLWMTWMSLIPMSWLSFRRVPVKTSPSTKPTWATHPRAMPTHRALPTHQTTDKHSLRPTKWRPNPMPRDPLPTTIAILGPPKQQTLQRLEAPIKFLPLKLRAMVLDRVIPQFLTRKHPWLTKTTSLHRLIPVLKIHCASSRWTWLVAETSKRISGTSLRKIHQSRTKTKVLLSLRILSLLSVKRMLKLVSEID